MENKSERRNSGRRGLSRLVPYIAVPIALGIGATIISATGDYLGGHSLKDSLDVAYKIGAATTGIAGLVSLRIADPLA